MKNNLGFFHSKTEKHALIRHKIKGFQIFYIIIDLLAILQRSLDRALFLYNFIREVRSSGVRGSTTIMHIRKFLKLHHDIVRFRFFPRIAKRSIIP